VTQAGCGSDSGEGGQTSHAPHNYENATLHQFRLRGRTSVDERLCFKGSSMLGLTF